MILCILRRAVSAGYLKASSLAAAYGMTDRAAQRWLAGERSPPVDILKVALRLMSPGEKAEVLMWISEETGGGCAVVDLETHRLVRALQACAQPHQRKAA